MTELRCGTDGVPIAALLIVMLVFLILDLHRSHRGLIQVSPKCLVDLHAGMRAGAAR